MPDINITLDNSDKVVNVTLEQEEPVIEVEVVSSGPAGAPGYTPVKGVDYFDGYTPVKGVDYFDGADGADGYTPVKGVDYFDGADGADGVSPEVSIGVITGGHSVTITDADHPGGQTFNIMDGTDGADGNDGNDGVSPTVSVTTITGGHQVDVTDAGGTTSFNVMDGADGTNGTNGQDGVSPGVTVATITGGHSVTITDADHPGGQSFNVMDGATGLTGPGVPNGGAAGQMLVKNSGTDQDTKWSPFKLPCGTLDNTSTATVMTVTIPGVTALEAGVAILVENNVIDSASGVTLNVNGLGAKPLYSSMSAATAITTLYKKGYTALFVYDENRVAGGCWVFYYGYYASGSNTIGYQLRTNKTSLPMADKVYRYRLLFTSPDGTKFIGANTSTSTDATTSKTPNTRAIDPFGRIVYYGTTTAVNAGSRPGATYIWDQYEIVLGYSFNWTGAALTLTSWNPVYLKCAPQADGSAIIDATAPIVQSLPSTKDGKIYVFLGVAYDATHIELYAWHPVYYYDGGIRLWTNPKAIPSASSATPAALGTAAAGSSNDYARADHVHAKPTAADIGATPSPFVVTLTPTSLDLSGIMNKTPAEIWDAYKAGQQIIFYVPMLNATVIANEYIEYDLNSDGENDAVVVYAYFPYTWMDNREVYVTLYTDLSTSIYGIVAYDFAAVVVNDDYSSESEPDVTILPCPMTYDFGECDELTVSPSRGYQGQYHFTFTCPSGTPTVLTFNGYVDGTSGDTLEAGKRYEVDIWNGVALIKNIEVTAI